MCVNTTVILNKKYLPTKKNGYNPPECPDEKFRHIEIPCGHCYECRKKKSREWQIRLAEELKYSTKTEFITLTINNESIDKIANENEINIQTADETMYNTGINKIATIAMRNFLENYRKEHSKSLRHWAVTERGHENTERIHIHAITFDPIKPDYLKHWKYGFTYTGEYCDISTINYIIKYMLKSDINNHYFIGKVLTSPGIGNKFTTSPKAGEHLFNKKKTNLAYRFQNGSKAVLPKYYKDKLYSEAERQELWSYTIDENIKYIGGEKLKNYNDSSINAIKKFYQTKYAQLYGDNRVEWNKVSMKRKAERQKQWAKLNNKQKKIKINSPRLNPPAFPERDEAEPRAPEAGGRSGA